MRLNALSLSLADAVVTCHSTIAVLSRSAETCGFLPYPQPLVSNPQELSGSLYFPVTCLLCAGESLHVLTMNESMAALCMSISTRSIMQALISCQSSLSTLYDSVRKSGNSEISTVSASSGWLPKKSLADLYKTP